jgi:cytochrome c553
MSLVSRPRLIRTIRFILYGLVAIALGGFLFAWSGLYSVAASRGHFALTNAILTFGMRNSVKTHSLGIEAPQTYSNDLSTLGAAHFHDGCAYCHGAPGVPIDPIAQSMLPPPPDLSKAVPDWRDRELFWIVKHGIKYTGMPAWVAPQRDDEVWAVVAFLKRLPTLDAAGYRELALGGLSIRPQIGSEIATTEDTSGAMSACARCHGADRRGPKSHLVPVLHGQPAEFLIAALEDFAAGRRASGIMQPVASALSPAERERVARYYAGLARPGASNRLENAAAVERGRELATRGDPNARIPPCMDCHSASALNAYPRLSEQHAAYIVNRLRNWQKGITSPSATDAIMAPIARSLNEQQIDDVAAYFASTSASISKEENQ